MRVDLHMHSTCSDGSDSVETIIDKAVDKHLEVISITDHDNVNGLARANAYAKGKIGFVNGIEISSFDERADMEIHILGYGIDYESELMRSKTAELLRLRKERILEIMDRLRAYDIIIEESDLDLTFAGRNNIATVMLDKHYVSTRNEAFDVYLGTNGSCYVPSNRMSPREAVELIHATGGIAGIAHPEKCYQHKILIDLIKKLKPYGLGALECHYPSHTDEMTGKLVRLARKYELIETVGSDYHGTNGTHMLGEVNFELSRCNVERLAHHKL